MKQRALQMRVVKTNKDKTTEVSEASITFEQTANIVRRQIEKCACTIGKGVIIYVVVDTLRQVIIAQTTKS